MVMIKNVNGVEVEMSAEEITQRETDIVKITADKEAEDNALAKKETDKDNANQKLKDLGLTDDEIKAIKGIS
jgi:hypothetical protein